MSILATINIYYCTICFVLAPYTPVGPIEGMTPGTWYLTAVDDMHRRTYKRVSLANIDSNTVVAADVSIGKVIDHINNYI